MLSVVLICSALSMGQQPSTPEEGPSPTVKVESGEPEALARYNEIRPKTPETAAEQWKLALWCEKNGLRPEAYFHLGRVVELDPRKDAAWQKLGFKKHDGRWMTPRQIAAEDEQKKADKDWAALLKKWHKEIHGGKKQAEAQAAFDNITDPAAVPSIYREFCGGGAADQEIAAQLLGQIEGPVASKVLAILAIYGKTPNLRRHATEILRNRPAEEFLDLLVSLMKDLLRYDVKPVGGPGSPGILFVEGERFNVRRFYAPPVPSYIPRPGDAIGYDANGMPVISRTTSSNHFVSMVGVPGSKTLATEKDAQVLSTETYSFANAMAEAQRSAMFAQVQLQGDIARVEAINQGRHLFNELVMAVAKGSTGKDPGRTPKDWRDMLAKGKDARYSPRTRTITKPTFGEMVPLDYVPNLAASITFQSQTRFTTKTIVDS